MPLNPKIGNVAQRDAISEARRPASSDGRKLAHWAVVAFHDRKDNRGRVRTFRRIWAFASKPAAVARFAGMHTTTDYYCTPAPPYGLVVLLHAEKVEQLRGDPGMAAEWTQTRRGVNKDANAYASASYGAREVAGRRGASYTSSGPSR